MGVRGLKSLLTDTPDASLTWTTPVELTAANCPPLVLDAAGFKMMVCQSEQVLSGAARLWRLDGGYDVACAELNRQLAVLATVAPEIHIVKDGIPPTSKRDELDARDAHRMDRGDATAAALATGRVNDIPDDMAKGVSGGLDEVYEAFVERHMHKRSRVPGASPDRPYVQWHRPAGEGDPECARVARTCDGLILAADTDFAVFDSPRGYLMLDSVSTRFAPGKVTGRVASPDQLVDGLNTLLVDLPGAVGITKECLPLFAALCGCDQTKSDEIYLELRQMRNKVTPCKRGMQCEKRATCKRSHSLSVLRGYACTNFWCNDPTVCGMSHGAVARRKMTCHKYATEGKCPHRNCCFSASPRATVNTAYHVVQGSQMSKQQNPTHHKSTLIAKFALSALLAARVVTVDGDQPDLLSSILAGVRAYDLEATVEDERVLSELRRSHGDVVWCRRRNGPRRGNCRMLMQWSDKLYATPCHPERSDQLPQSVNSAVAWLRELAVRVNLCWSASLPPAEWPSEARPDQGPNGIEQQFTWKPARSNEDSQLLQLSDLDTAHRCDWMPELTKEQEAKRPLLQHTSYQDRAMAIVLAAGMSTPDGERFMARISDWAVTSHKMVFGALNVEPPEILAVALRVMWLNCLDLTIDELSVFAELVVCRDGPSLHSAVFEPDNSAVVATTGWHPRCVHDRSEERVCCAAPDDFGSDTYKRRADLVAQWKAAVQAVNDANRALHKPLMECDSTAAYRDGAVIHSMLALGRSRVGCKCKEHQAVMQQLVAVVKSKLSLSPAPSPKPSCDGGDRPVSSDATPSCGYDFMRSDIPSQSASQRREKAARERRRLAAAVKERADLVRRLRSDSPSE